MKPHDIIIYFIIGIILVGQIYLFLKNYKKIKEFDKILPLQKGLETVSVNLNSDEIATIDPNYILNNLNKFTSKEDVELLDIEPSSPSIEDSKFTLFDNSDFEPIENEKI